MTTYAPGVPPQSRNPRSASFPLLDGFILTFLASAVEPLHMASQLSGRELYRWHTLSLDGRQIWAGDGLQIIPDAGTDNAPAVDYVIVCGGVGIQRSVTREHVTSLQAQAHQGRRLGVVCTDSWALARAGLLGDYNYNVHWECLAAMQEAFPRVAMSIRLFSIGRNRFTSSGGTAPTNMTLHLIGREHGREPSATISEMFIYECIRNEQGHRCVLLKHMLGTSRPRLQEIVALVEASLEEPIGLDELAVYVSVSHRQLERLFQRYLHCSPSRYYLKLRLVRAHQLPKQTSISIIKVTSVRDFVSTLHFSKCYHEYLGISPRNEHQDQPLGQPVVLVPISQDLALIPNSSALSVLSQAQDESTFASMRI